MPPASFHVLVAVENQSLRKKIVDSLTAADFYFETSLPAEAPGAVQRYSFDAVLLSMEGVSLAVADVCRSLRSVTAELGILVLVGDGPTESESALDAGADDCVAAPFRFREIVARLGAVLRRAHVETISETTVLQAGDMEMDVEHRRFRRGECEVHLSPREFDLLSLLMKNPEVTLTHLKLLRAVWGGEFVYGTSRLRSYIKTLRKKVEADPARPEYILTEPWVGYRFHNPHSPLQASRKMP